MKTINFLNKHTFITAIFIAGLQITSVQAAPGPLAQAPLFLTTAVPANIFFGIDDSGSMDWETTLNSGTFSPGDATRSTIDFTPDTVGERRDACRGFNVLAYNPNFVYSPWRGEDENGFTYSDKTLTTALNNPYDNDDIDDISSHRYFVWTDTDADGAYDGPGSISYDENYNATDECAVQNNNAGIEVNTLTAAQQQNYANWYSYYRKREYVAKRAISELIWNSNERMGLATLHDNNSVGTPIENMTDSTKKEDLLDELGQINSTGGTPLRLLLRNVGRYFDEAGSNSDHSALGFTNSSPILSAAAGGACQQNFNVLFSDGFWNGGSPSVGEHDSDDDSSWDGGSHEDNGGVGAGFSNTLADVAMLYYETDLSTTLGNNVSITPGVDENPAQHLVTYTVAFGISGGVLQNPPDRTSPTWDHDANPGTANAGWPQPVANAASTADDMRHAAWNSRGEFLSARDPGTLIAALEAALNSIADRKGNAAAVTFNSNTLQNGAEIFLSQFNSDGWTGDVLSFDLDGTTGALSVNPNWSAAMELDTRNISTSPRDMYTFNGVDGIYFNSANWANLTTAQQNDLKTNPDMTTAPDATAQARMDFINGDRSNEGTGLGFRTRNSIMGDIIHSAPEYVGAPPQGLYPDNVPFGASGEYYSDYANDSTIMNRTPVVYAGSNYGFMHGFNANNGTEEVAYIPNFLFDTGSASGMHYLTNPAYAHTYFVDLATSINHAYVKTSPTGGRDWRTILLGGARAGGKGIFALDVTNPNDYTSTASNISDVVMWEFDSTDDTDLGFTYSEPRAVMLSNNKWGVIFGNGFNNDGSGEAALFILLLEGGLNSAITGEHGDWVLGTNYFKLSTGVGTTSDKNGLGSVTPVDIDNDQIVDRVYAGDVKGNMWAFDVSDASPSNWGSAYTSGGNPAPLFNTASDLPITVKPVVTRLPTVPTTPTNSPNIMVYFGTGQYLNSADITDTTKHHFYGIWDAGDGNLTTSDLVQQTVSTDPAQANARFVTDNPAVYLGDPTSGNNYGWYFQLPDNGERVIIDALVVGNLVLFGTLIPSDDICNQGGGDGWLMAVKTYNGGDPEKGAFDFTNDGIVDASDQCTCGAYAAGKKFEGSGFPSGLAILGDKIYVSDSWDTSATGSGSVLVSSFRNFNQNTTGRLTWQELVDED